MGFHAQSIAPFENGVESQPFLIRWNPFEAMTTSKNPTIRSYTSTGVSMNQTKHLESGLGISHSA
jgi:hypothetical protein